MLLVLGLTELITGLIPSITKLLLSLREFEAPGDANVRVASSEGASVALIVADPVNASAPVET